MTEVAVSSVGERVALVEMRRPPANFFDEELLTAVADALLGIDDDASVSAVVLCSEGRHFCAGADLRGMGEAGIRRVYRQALRIFTSRKPIVAAMQGSAVGGGLGLALAADFRVASPTARLTANFARLGFHQGFGLTVTLPAIVGQQAAMDLLYTGRDVSGVEALELKLVDRIDDAPREAAVDYARRIASSAPLSLPLIKGSLRRRLVSEVAAALDLEAGAQASLLASADFAEGVKAAVEKRQPRFGGS